MNIVTLTESEEKKKKITTIQNKAPLENALQKKYEQKYKLAYASPLLSTPLINIFKPFEISLATTKST